MKQEMIIKKGKFLHSNDLLSLRGGTGTETTFVCKHGAEIIGCITLSTCNVSDAETYCRTLDGFNTIVYSCGHVVSCNV